MTKLNLCRKCLSEYKRSREGVRARKNKKAGRDAQWGKGLWPMSVYHSGCGPICKNHSIIHAAEVRGAYESRGFALLEIGFRSYSAYLKSDLWKVIRSDCIEAFDGLCFFCESPASQVHHGSYSRETMEGNRPSNLFPVCRKCHVEAEFEAKGVGEKCSPREATSRLRRHGCERGFGKIIRRNEAKHRDIAKSCQLASQEQQ